jgi:hypothetical protein
VEVGESGVSIMADRPQKITFAEIRDSGMRGLLAYCADYHCSHSLAVSADHWPDDLPLVPISKPVLCAETAANGRRRPPSVLLHAALRASKQQRKSRI